MSLDFMSNAENIQPLKEGRRPEILFQAPMDSRRQRTEFENAQLQLERNLSDEELGPLHSYIQYIKRIKDVFPSGSKHIQEALHDAGMYLMQFPELKNDPRLLNIFLDLADKQRDPRETFQFMKENDVAQLLPKYHLALARVLEKNKEFDRAMASYESAVRVAKTRMGDKPEDFELAALHLSHFQRRMKRRAQEARALHGVRSPQAARMIRSQQQQQPLYQQPQQIVPIPLKRSSQQQPFTVFNENQLPSSKPPAKRTILEAPPAKWKTISKDQENQGPVQSWASAKPLPSTAPLPATAAGGVKKKAFAIFTDTINEEEEEESVRVQLESVSLSKASTAFTPKITDLMLRAPVQPRSMPGGMNSPTVHTRTAGVDLMGIFSSPVNGEEDVVAVVEARTPAVEDHEENGCPNLSGHLPLRREPALGHRLPFKQVESHEDEYTPSSRRAMSQRPKPQREAFVIAKDVEQIQDDTYDGETFGIGRALAFEASPPKSVATSANVSRSFPIFRD